MRHIYLPIVIAFAFQVSSFSQSPLIVVMPDSLIESLQTGGTSTQTLTIANNGTSNLNFEIALGYNPPEDYHNYALLYDGLDDYLNMGEGIDLANRSFTLEVWAKRSAIGVWHALIGQGSPYSDVGLHVGFRENDVFTFAFYSNDLNTPISYTDSDWHHWACTFDAPTKVRKIYRDGLVVADDIATDNYQGSGTFYIGRSSWGNDNFDGIIDEVRIWNAELSETQIQQNMYRELLGTEPGLISYWRFNEGIGDTTFDITFNGNNGTLNNGVEWVTSTAPISPFWLNVNLISGTVTPGSSIDIDVNFDASGLQGGNYDMFIIISSNDPVNPELVVPVNLEVTSAPDIVLSKDSLEYGEVFIGDSVTNSFLIYNYGFELLTVNSISSNNPDYALNISNFNLDPGESQEVAVTFSPNNVGSSTGILTINSNDPYEPTLTVDLFGIGLEPPVISITPASFNESLLTGGTSTQILTISNNGNSNLLFDIVLGYSLPSEYQNYALEYDGIDDYVKVTNYDLAYSAFTVEAWVYLDAISWYHEVIDNVEGDFQLEIWSDLSIMFDAVGEGSRLTSDPNVMPLNQWVHLAGVYDGVESLIYMNGNLVAQRNLTGSINRPNTTIHFGTETNGGEQFWDGKIDEVRLWNLARSEMEIQQNMFRELPAIQPGLISYWQFNEGVGDTTFDKTFNGNNGALQNGVQWVASTAPISPLWLTVNPDSGIVAPGSSAEIELIFNAAGLDGDEYDVEVVVFSNDPLTPEVIIPVHLDVTSAPDLTVSEDNLNFGGVFIGGNKTKQLVVYNYGFETLSVTDITSSNPNYFVNYTNFTLEPGGNKIVNATYIPATVGSDPGTLTIHSNDPYEPEYIINLQGEGLVAPIVNVAPDSLSVILESDSSVTEVLTVSNTGGNQLEFEIDIENIPVSLGKYSFIPLMTKDKAVAADEKRYNKDFSPVRASIFHKSSNVNQTDIMFYEGINVLLITSGIYPSEIKNLLLSYTDINTVDVFDAYQSTPTLSQLVAYNSIIVMNNYPFGDPAALGDVLADYVDAGGGVILTLATFVTDWEIKGRLSNEDYLPFNVGPGPLGSASLGNYNPNHAIMEGVTNAGGELLADITLASGAELVAEWDNNYPFIATKGPMVAAINVFITNSGFWSDDIPLIIYNSVKWCGGWLSAEPKSGIISSGSHMNINMTFGTAGMNEGDYYADIIFFSNDPLTPVMAIPAHMHLESPTGIKEEDILPAEYSLYQNFPNPFNPVTTIKFDLPEKSEVLLNIYNILGEKVKTIINKELEAGSHKVKWDARSVGSGVYIYRIKAGDYIGTRKMVYLK